MSDLLIWMKSSRSEFEEQGELGAWEGSQGGVEVVEQFFDGAVMSGMGEVVEPDGECVGGRVGDEICLGLKDLPDEGAGIVVTAGQMWAQE